MCKSQNLYLLHFWQISSLHEKDEKVTKFQTSIKIGSWLEWHWKGWQCSERRCKLDMIPVQINRFNRYFIWTGFHEVLSVVTTGECKKSNCTFIRTKLSIRVKMIPLFISIHSFDCFVGTTHAFYLFANWYQMLLIDCNAATFHSVSFSKPNPVWFGKDTPKKCVGFSKPIPVWFGKKNWYFARRRFQTKFRLVWKKLMTIVNLMKIPNQI